jgi:orotate phosphoribosyltransferase
VLLALDREERGQGELSAVQEVQATFGLRCVSIVTLGELIATLEAASTVQLGAGTVAAMRQYRAQYGIAP